MRILDIAVFIWILQFTAYIVVSLFGGQAQIPETFEARSGIPLQELVNPQFYFSEVLIAAVSGTILAGFLLYITERGGFFIIGVITLIGIYLMLRLLSIVIGPVFGLGTTINDLLAMFFNIPGVPPPQLPDSFATMLNAYGYFITLLAVADIFGGRRMRDYGF